MLHALRLSLTLSEEVSRVVCLQCACRWGISGILLIIYPDTLPAATACSDISFEMGSRKAKNPIGEETFTTILRMGKVSTS